MEWNRSEHFRPDDNGAAGAIFANAGILFDSAPLDDAGGAVQIKGELLVGGKPMVRGLVPSIFCTPKVGAMEGLALCL